MCFSGNIQQVQSWITSLLWSLMTWAAMSDWEPVQEQLTSNNFLNGHSLLSYRQKNWCLFLPSIVNVSSHPASLFLDGYIAVAAFFSRVIFRTLINLPLKLGHAETRSLPLLQTLCPFSHIVIGGAIHSKQTGHSSSFKRIHSSRLSDIFCNVLQTCAAKHYEKESSKSLRHSYVLGRHDTTFS